MRLERLWVWRTLAKGGDTPPLALFQVLSHPPAERRAAAALAAVCRGNASSSGGLAGTLQDRKTKGGSRGYVTWTWYVICGTLDVTGHVCVEGPGRSPALPASDLQLTAARQVAHTGRPGMPGAPAARDRGR